MTQRFVDKVFVESLYCFPPIGSLRLSRGELAEDETSLTSLTMPELTEAEAAGGASGLAAFRHLRSSEDIESFIANMAVPPPPSLAAKQVQGMTDY